MGVPWFADAPRLWGRAGAMQWRDPDRRFHTPAIESGNLLAIGCRIIGRQQKFAFS
ncbi:hypothetical protein KK141_09970 [Dyella sp. LX-66]|uniref:hypothetical protein n=1 Tax=unclassified Dyella TaxID=2634549 RepID=UPI001BE0237F|nr:MULTISPECIES: hypothetical protein [unclassified Dyella]MBT2117066.1 hypothetical protein [Dyella sp. LX-1]MBT2139858.1 hypothetical protein [Dyella sp. LX-66]